MSRESEILQRSPAAFVNVVYAVLLVVLAVVPRSIAASHVSVSDVAAHSVAYGGQGLLLLWGLRPVFGVGRAAVLAAVGATALGLFTEVVQSVLPYREFSLADLGADAIGAVAGVGIAIVLGFGRRTGVKSQ